MKKIILAVLITAFATPALAARSITAKVNGLVCSFCAAAIESRLKGLGVAKAVYVDLTQKVVALELQDGKDVSPEKVAAEIKEAGYDVVSIERSERSIGEIRGAAKKK